MGGPEAHTWVVSHKDLVQLRRRSRPFRRLGRPAGRSGFADGEVPGLSDVVWTSMVEMDEGFVLPESDSLQGSRGDFLAFRPDGTGWIVDADEVDRSYELIEPRDDDGRTRVFISYARDDVKTAGGKQAFDTLKGLLASSDDISVFDDGRLAGGDLWRERIVDWIATAHVVVVVVGYQLRQKDDGVARKLELPLALMARAERDIRIVPVLLNDLDRGVTVRPLDGRSVDILDFNSPAGVLLPEPEHPHIGHLNKASEKIRDAVAKDGKAVKTQWALWAETPGHGPRSPAPPRRRDPIRRDSRMAEDKGEQFHAFISYVREDATAVNRLQRVLEDHGIRTWRDTQDLWPGEDWRDRIRLAITTNSLAFIACFSHRSLARSSTYQNEELALAIEQLRQRRPDQPWLLPVRLSDCDIPPLDLGGGRNLRSLQRVDLFDDRWDQGAARLVVGIERIVHSLGQSRR